MPQLSPNCDNLIALFNKTFTPAFNTRLEHADKDPEYIPANANTPQHRIRFAHGFVASALHEIAHWTIAGAERRQHYDFGYWYEPDGRNAAQQAAFFQVEVKPQALEWIFSEACGLPFQPSLDNLYGETADSTVFCRSVAQQAQAYCHGGMPPRAATWAAALAARFKQPGYLNPQRYRKPARAA